MIKCPAFKGSQDKLYKLLTAKNNKKMEKAFSLVPYPERVVFVPQCMRNIGRCKAKESGSYYICAECNACKVGAISKKSRELGYKALYILKGGRAVEKVIRDLKPKAVLGVACYFEGAEGMRLCRKNGAVVQFVPLTKDGCENTDVNLDEALNTLQKK